MTHPSKIRIWEPLLTFVVIGIAIIYGINAFNTGNWLWFMRGSNDVVQPSQIVVVNYGERTVYQPGSPEFERLATAVTQSLSRMSNTDLISIGLSEQTLDDYATDSLIVELYFDQPVVLHSLARSGEPTQLLIPVDGRHAGGGYVFRGDNGEWWFGALRMADPQPLFAALSAVGYSAAAPLLTN